MFSVQKGDYLAVASCSRLLALLIWKSPQSEDCYLELFEPLYKKTIACRDRNTSVLASFCQLDTGWGHLGRGNYN